MRVMCNPVTTDNANFDNQKNEMTANASAKSKEEQPTTQTQRSCTTFAFAQPHRQTNKIYSLTNITNFATLLH